MADGDEQRPHPRAAAQHGADHLAAVEQRRGGTFLPPRRLERADQPRLGDADRRQPREHAHVAGEAQAARVGNALAVAEQQVGPSRQAGERRQQRRRLAERQQAGDVGEVERPTGQRALQQLQAWPGQQRGRAPHQTAGGLIVSIEAGDQSYGIGAAAALDAAAQPLLQRARLGSVTRRPPFDRIRRPSPSLPGSRHSGSRHCSLSANATVAREAERPSPASLADALRLAPAHGIASGRSATGSKLLASKR
jgi:hypothetical protein